MQSKNSLLQHSESFTCKVTFYLFDLSYVNMWMKCTQGTVSGKEMSFKHMLQKIFFEIWSRKKVNWLIKNFFIDNTKDKKNNSNIRILLLTIFTIWILKSFRDHLCEKVLSKDVKVFWLLWRELSPTWWLDVSLMVLRVCVCWAVGIKSHIQYQS